MNWSKAVDANIQYVRVLVVKSIQAHEYQEVVASINTPSQTMQQTMVMSMPDKLDLSKLTKLSPAYKTAGASNMQLDDSLGVGYARLCIQLVAHALQLSHVWMLDNNVQDCWQLDLAAESLHTRQVHG